MQIKPLFVMISVRVETQITKHEHTFFPPLLLLIIQTSSTNIFYQLQYSLYNLKLLSMISVGTWAENLMTFSCGIRSHTSSSSTENFQTDAAELKQLPLKNLLTKYRPRSVDLYQVWHVHFGNIVFRARNDPWQNWEGGKWSCISHLWNNNSNNDNSNSCNLPGKTI